MKSLKIKKFDPNTIRKNSRILFCGPPRCGKSYCMRDFLYHIKDRVFDAVAFSATVEEDHPLTNYIPCLLYTSPSPRDLSTSRMPSSA